MQRQLAVTCRTSGGACQWITSDAKRYPSTRSCRACRAAPPRPPPIPARGRGESRRARPIERPSDLGRSPYRRRGHLGEARTAGGDAITVQAADHQHNEVGRARDGTCFWETIHTGLFSRPDRVDTGHRPVVGGATSPLRTHIQLQRYSTFWRATSSTTIRQVTFARLD